MLFNRILTIMASDSNAVAFAQLMREFFRQELRNEYPYMKTATFEGILEKRLGTLHEDIIAE